MSTPASHTTPTVNDAIEAVATLRRLGQGGADDVAAALHAAGVTQVEHLTPATMPAFLTALLA